MKKKKTGNYATTGNELPMRNWRATATKLMPKREDKEGIYLAMPSPDHLG